MRYNDAMKRGFTILELLIVIAVIGMLASIIFVAFANVQSKSRDTRRIEDMREIQKALNLYYIDGNRFPQSSTAVALTGDDPVSEALVASGAIAGISGDPVSPEFNYTYQATSSAQYIIRFCLETDTVPNYQQGCNNTVTP